MKKIITIIISILLCFGACLGLAACGDDSDENPHEHSFVEGKCECGAKDGSYVECEHKNVMVMKANEVDATCSAEGGYDEVVYCMDCGKFVSTTAKVIEKLAHTPAEAVVENKVDATCSAAGSFDEVVYCSVCDAEISRVSKAIEKLAHTAAEAVRENEIAATCTADGSYDEVVKCSVCGEELSRVEKVIEIVGHVYVDGVCSGCGAEISEWAMVLDRGYFVCGITMYTPMNYYDDSGNLVGFDTELAKAVADYLGVDVAFKTIDWDSKYLELNSGKIDLIWNGFTYGYESDGTHRSEYVDFSHVYLKNEQCIVVRKADLSKYTTKAAFAGKIAGVAGGSHGVSIAEALGAKDDKLVEMIAQTHALIELAYNQVDYAVIDLQMAKAMVGTGAYEDLAICTVSDFAIEPELYAIGARNGSDITAKINEALEALYNDGTIAAIAIKYGLEYDVVEM